MSSPKKQQILHAMQQMHNNQMVLWHNYRRCIRISREPFFNRRGKIIEWLLVHGTCDDVENAISVVQQGHWNEREYLVYVFRGLA